MIIETILLVVLCLFIAVEAAMLISVLVFFVSEAIENFKRK